MERVTRIGVSLEPKLLEEFDKIIEKQGYKNRSEAIRDLIREKIVNTRWLKGEEELVATITLLYKHHDTTTIRQLLRVQHVEHTKIYSTTHIHLDEQTCLEVLIIHGKPGDMQKLADRIKALRGVLYLGLVVTSASLGTYKNNKENEH